jgi:uncharacterized membrane protein YraQ (UPF0718 family)
MLHMAYQILAASWHVFLESAVYMLFGFFFAGLLYVFVKPETISRYLGKGKVRSVFLSALAGIPIPLCSCGVVPAAAGLKRQGASNGATLSFLISTPESGIDSIPITYALMDPVITLVRPVAALITAIVAGITENFFNNSNDIPDSAPPDACSVDGCGCKKPVTDETGPAGTSLSARILSGLKYAFVDLLGDIGKWFLIGVFLAGLITYFVPDNLFESYLSNNFLAMLVMLVIGMPMYVCATSSTPIAAALVLKGLNPGAALVFLLAGPATNIASLTMVSGLLGRKSLFIYLGSIAVCSLVLGFLTDMLYYGIGITAKASAGQFSEIFPYSIELTGAIVLLALLLFAFYSSFKGNTTCS